MKEISTQSFMKIHDIIHGQNYVNIKARLNQLLPEYYSDIFSGVNMDGTQGMWYGDEHKNYQSYSSASDAEKEEIATFLEGAKNYVCEELSSSMPFVNSLFTIPSQNEIFWFRDENGDMHVTLAQWGFENRSNGPKVDVIGMLISAPRTITQQDITLHIDFSDGECAANASFLLHLFNNKKEFSTDDNGNFHLGKLFLGKEFAVSTLEEEEYQSFPVIKDGSYKAIFDLTTNYTIITEDEKGEPLEGKEISIDGVNTVTNDKGYYEQSLVLQPNHTIVVTCEEHDYSFSLNRNPEENIFHIVLKKHEVPEPPIPPTPPIIPPTPPTPQYISIELLDYDGKPLPNMPFTINVKGEEPIKAQTDDNGIAQIEKSKFKTKKKYKINFKVTSSYRENLKKK